jgi:general secretion pathway protein L
MGEKLILFLPPEAALADGGSVVEAAAWVRMAGGRVLASGVGDGWLQQDIEAGEGGAVVAFAPACDAPVRFVQYETALPMQAAAAARMDALGAVLGDRAQAHVAAAVPAEVGQSFAVCVTRQRAMAAWTAWLAAKGVAVEAIVPAALILPPPEEHKLTRGVIGGELVMRSAHHGYASDAAVDALMRDGGDVQDVAGEALERALAFAADMAPVNLLSGAWAAKRGWGVDAGVMRWVKRLAAALLVLSVAVPAVQAVRLSRDAARADAAVLEGAAQMGIVADDAAGAEAELDRRLAQKSGGPLAFSVPASALYAALADVPAVRVTSLSHRRDGTLTAMMAAPRGDDVASAVSALRARGYSVSDQAAGARDGQYSAHVTIRAVR